MIVAGLVGAGISGPLLDKIKQFKSLCKPLVPQGVALLIAYNCYCAKAYSLASVALELDLPTGAGRKARPINLP